MKKQKIAKWAQTYIAAAVHLLLTVICVFFGHDSGVPIIAALVVGIGYLIFCIVTMILNKSRIPWYVFLTFLLGTVIQTVLNGTEVIPPDGGFLSGIGQFIYCGILILATGIVGLVNLIVFIVSRISERRSHNAAEYESVFDGYRSDI